MTLQLTRGQPEALDPRLPRATRGRSSRRRAAVEPERAGRALRLALGVTIAALIAGAFQCVYASTALASGPDAGSSELHGLVARLGREPAVLGVVLAAMAGVFGLTWGVPCAAVVATRVRETRGGPLPRLCVVSMAWALPAVLVLLASHRLGDALYGRLGGEWEAPA